MKLLALPVAALPEPMLSPPAIGLMRSADAISVAQAGLLSGTFVAGSFFVGDLIHLAPLSTVAEAHSASASARARIV